MNKLNRQILMLALPAILNNITVPLLGLCDTAVSGHLGSAAYMGAIAVGAMMVNVIYWLCGFLRAGTAGMTAQAFGGGNFATARNVLRKSISIGLVISLGVIILQRPLESVLLSAMTPGEPVASLARLYFRTLIWAAPAQLCIIAISGWFIGMQNTVVPMIVAIGVNVINIGMTITCVYLLGMGLSGIPVGTLIANWTGVAGASWFVVREIRKNRSSQTGEVVKWSRFFGVNRDLFFRSACIMGVTLALTSIGAEMGETVLAANAVMMQYFLFFSYFMDGFAFAAEAMVGKAAGSKNHEKLKGSVRALLKWGVGMAVVFLCLYAVAGGWITSLLTDVENVREAVAQLRPWLIALPPITVAAFIFDGVFIGLTRTGWLFVTTLGAALTFFAIVYIPRISGNGVSQNILWLAFESYLLFRGLSLSGVYKILSHKGRLTHEIN